MNTEEMISKAAGIIREHLGVEPEKIVPDANFYDDLGADSLDMVELTMAFEEEFGVEIADSEAEKVDTVRDATDLLAAKLAA